MFKNLFKKSKKQKPSSSAQSDLSNERDGIVLCIPGDWSDRSDFIQRLAREFDGRLLVSGLVMMDTEAKEFVEFIFEPADPNISAAFEVSSVYDPLSDPEKRALKNHTSVVYLVSKQKGLDEASRIARFGALLCDAGGIGVKVEVAGRAFSASEWKKRHSEFETNRFVIYDTFVFPAVSASSTEHQSVGMPQFGLPDTKIVGVDDLDYALHVIRVFNFFLLIDEPVIKAGETFSENDEAPRYRISHEPHSYDKSKHLDYSEGVWCLSETSNNA